MWPYLLKSVGTPDFKHNAINFPNIYVEIAIEYNNNFLGCRLNNKTGLISVSTMYYMSVPPSVTL